MKQGTIAKMEEVMERARKEGYAVVGFAVLPDDTGIIKLDNQSFERQQFIDFVNMALHSFALGTSEENKSLIVMDS